MSIELVIAGHPVTAEVLSRDEATSLHTGRPLLLLEVELRVHDRSHEEFVEALQLGKAGIEGPAGARFKVAGSSYSYSDTLPGTVFKVKLEEVEELRPARVLLDGRLSLIPDRYEEHFDGGITIEMTTATSGDNTDVLEAAIIKERHYFTVLCEGVRDRPLMMRFGRCLWQNQEGGARGHLLVLVERPYDEQRTEKMPLGGLLSQPQLQRAQEAIASLQTLTGRLLDRLVDAGLMSLAEVTELREQAARVDRSQLRQFQRADDLKEF